MKKYIHSGELVFWIVIIFLVVFLVRDNIHLFSNTKSNYSIEFTDIDGIDIGAPVNFMGIEVGSVAGIKQNGNKVIVDFALNKEGIHFPKGSTVTIQFTGLVGSKTLEIEPPKTISRFSENLIAVEPVRINSFVEISAKTSESLASGSHNILKAFGKGSITFIQEKIIKVKDFSHTTLETTENIYFKMKESRVFIVNTVVNLNNYLENLNSSTERFNILCTQNDYKNTSKSFVKLLKFSFDFIYSTFRDPQYKDLLSDAKRSFLFFNRLMDYNKNTTIKKINADQLIQYIGNLDNRLSKTSGVFSRIYNKIKTIDPNIFFNRLLKKSAGVEKTTYKMQKAI